MSPNTNGQFYPYIGIYAQDLRERRENIDSLILEFLSIE